MTVPGRYHILARVSDTVSWRRLVRVARRQQGHFTTAQAERAGISRTKLTRLAAAGRIERVHRGVYRISGTPDTWQGRAVAAVLATGHAGVLSGLAAAHLHGLTGSERPPEITLLIPRGREVRVPGVAVRSASVLPPYHVTEVDGIRVLTVERTLVDLAGLVGAAALRVMVIDAWRQRRTDPGRVAACAAEVGWSRGRAHLRRAIAACHPQLRRARSVAEIVAFLALVDAGIRLPEVNVRVRTASGWRELDLAYRHQRYGLEVDSERFHSTAPDRRSDASKDRELAAEGWDVDRVPVRVILGRPDRFVATVIEGLRRNGCTEVATHA